MDSGYPTPVEEDKNVRNATPKFVQMAYPRSFSRGIILYPCGLNSFLLPKDKLRPRDLANALLIVECATAGPIGKSLLVGKHLKYFKMEYKSPATHAVQLLRERVIVDQ